ncbi:MULTISPECIES: hypothetical protein [Ureaplasma]|uniref:hypothetical protein n=1 Tax=Ureaplasma TaxID=2129 RepID=UPI00307DC8F7
MGESIKLIIYLIICIHWKRKNKLLAFALSSPLIFSPLIFAIASCAKKDENKDRSELKSWIKSFDFDRNNFNKQTQSYTKNFIYEILSYINFYNKNFVDFDYVLQNIDKSFMKYLIYYYMYLNACKIEPDFMPISVKD